MKAQKLQPTFSLDQFATIAFLLLLIAFTLTGLFSLYSPSPHRSSSLPRWPSLPSMRLYCPLNFVPGGSGLEVNCRSKDKSKVSGGLAALVYAVPASVFFGYVSGTVWC